MPKSLGMECSNAWSCQVSTLFPTFSGLMERMGDVREILTYFYVVLFEGRDRLFQATEGHGKTLKAKGTKKFQGRVRYYTTIQVLSVNLLSMSYFMNSYNIFFAIDIIYYSPFTYP